MMIEAFKRQDGENIPELQKPTTKMISLLNLTILGTN
jgi:hypothetical protein